MLDGKRILVTGVLTRRSIAFAVAQQAQREGAEVLLTGFGRSRRMTERTAARLDRPVEVLELDVRRPEDFRALTEAIDARWGGLDGALHAIAHAPADAFEQPFVEVPAASALSAFEISALSLNGLARALVPLFEPNGGGSLVGLDFDASQAWPGYGWMGVAKAGLEAVSRYLAHELGPRGIRSNLVAAGSLRTEAASGMPDLERMASEWEHGAPLGWDSEDPAPVAEAVCFLLSDRARAISGEILHVDGGRHAVAPSTDGVRAGALTTGGTL
ncbi:MAG TPA: enoyl-ACP reductase FabI [Thermoleophilaceae bacterium]